MAVLIKAYILKPVSSTISQIQQKNFFGNYQITWNDVGVHYDY